MNWTRSETLALAKQGCTLCMGLGLCQGRSGNTRPCNCVFRAVFRACYERFRQCASQETHISRVRLEENPGRQLKHSYSLKNEEYLADFVLVSKRVLGEGTFSHRLFKYHFLLGADWKLCCRKLGIDRGEFFHEVYRIQQRLGRAFRELEPYGLFPLDEYFGGRSAKHERPAAVLPLEVPATAEMLARYNAAA